MINGIVTGIIYNDISSAAPLGYIWDLVMQPEAGYKEVARVRDFMEKSFKLVKSDEKISGEPATGHSEIFVVVDGDGNYLGVVTPLEACKAGKESRYADIARRDYPTIDPETSVLKALEIMAITNTTVLPVVDSKKPVGVITLFAIYKWLSEALDVEEFYTAG